MAASKAPSTTINVSSSTSSSSSWASSSLNTTTTTTSQLTTLTDSPSDICHNFHELCRSCGKTNSELYDLFQASTSNSPFNTSSTTCYSHLNTTSTTTSSSMSATNKSTAKTISFDSLAATAKASAKGQSNMDNILQEMQIWQLMIKCNDGLPQRICAKCTAQFYMIHKFRRKCLKVQTQLRALSEEQKFYERQQQQQQQQEQKEKSVVVSEKEATTIEATSTPPPLQPPPSPLDSTVTVAKSASSKLAPAIQEESSVLPKDNDLVKDNSGEQQQKQQTQLAVDNTKSSATFERNTGNTIESDVSTISSSSSSKAITLLDNVETMPPQKTVAIQNRTATAFNDDNTFKAHDRETLARDEKKPLLKAAVLNFIRSPTLTSKRNFEQICDNDATTAPTTTKQQTNKKSCLDEEELMATHIIFKSSSFTKPSKPESDDEVEFIGESSLQNENLFKSKPAPSSKAFRESLFITKAALKAYNNSPSSTFSKSSAAINAKNANDNNNNNPFTPLCDNRLGQDNNNTLCSSPSSSYSSTSRSSSRKSFRMKVLRNKIVKYTTAISEKQNSKLPRTTIVRMSLKKKQRSWKNKHKLKRLDDLKTCCSSSESSISATRKRGRSKKLKMCSKKQKKHEKRLADRRNDEEETSSIVSTATTTSVTSSSLASSTTSSSLSSTTNTSTPAVCVDLIGNDADAITSDNDKNLKKTGSSSIEGISSLNISCMSLWKTKAAMKANASDMTMDDNVSAENDDADGDAESSSNAPETSTLPYIVTGSTASPDISSKTLPENSSISSSTNNMFKEENCDTNKVISSLSDNQVKDTEYDNQQKVNHNLKTEESDQKQINANQPVNDGNVQETIEIVKTKLETKEFNNSKVIKEDNSEKAEKDNEEKQKPAVLTPPSKVGCMKLIIQRKRGARFRCRPKDDIDEPHASSYNEHEATTPKRKRKSSYVTNLQRKWQTESLFLQELNVDCNKEDHEAKTEENINSEEDENKENPIPLENIEFDNDSNSNISVYRDPLLLQNETPEDDTVLTDFPKTQLSLQTECSKETYKLYKEKANLESPKKLIIRVPLTSLTQDFKRLHLTKEQEVKKCGQENETPNEENQDTMELKDLPSNNETVETPNSREQEISNNIEINSSQQTNCCSSQSDLLGFSQNTETSSSTSETTQHSLEMPRYIQPPLCSASSKINDFINDFQNNCIDSSEIDETCDMVPHLGPRITQELSDEIRDVEDTLNGILSEMHDKDMYTPRSGETDEFFSHSVYSPLTDSPTTPSHSFYAESPCTINSNPMSVSPFVHQNMDYNAMTPQSNHSSMGHSSHLGAGGSTAPHREVFSEHLPSYNECFEESTQSELIGFQNDIPCFENIAIENQAAAANLSDIPEDLNDEKVLKDLAPTNSEDPNSAAINMETSNPSQVVDYIDLSDYKETSEEFVPNTHKTSVQLKSITEVLPNLPIPYQTANYHHVNSPTMQNSTTQPHYIVTNSNQGPIIISSPQVNQTTEQVDAVFKPHNQNMQFVTLGQALEANQQQANHIINNSTPEINWQVPVNNGQNFSQQQLIPATNGTTTYFINANGELYQASIPANTLSNAPLNTIIVPNNQAQSFNKANMENNDNYIHTVQQQQIQHPNNNPSSQYIMLVNNLGGTPQYYATTPANLNQTVATPPPTVLFHQPQAQNISNNTNYLRNSTNPSSANNETKPSTLNQIKATQVPVSEIKPDNNNSPTMHQKINQQLQKQIKQRQLQLLQPRSPNAAQKITLICRFCHKRPKFTNNVDYSNHIINTHPAEKPYNCPNCPMHFTRRFERQQHVAQYHGSRYQCAQCGLSFCAQRTLDFHLQKYHANLGRSHQQHLQLQNSTSTMTPATYQLLQHNQQQRLVRVEDVHVQVTDENKNKRSIDLVFDGSADIQTSQSMTEVEILSDTTGTQQQTLKLCCPDCNGEEDDCCGLNENDQTNNDNNSNNDDAQTEDMQQQQQIQEQQNAGNRHNQQNPPHITIPSPEQTEPDSTTTLRHFRKRQLCEISPHFSTSPSSSSSSSSLNKSTSCNSSRASNDNLNHHSPDHVFLGGDGGGNGDGEHIVVERSLRAAHNCLLCEESFTNEIALRKHHHLAHGATQSMNNTNATSTGLACTICKRVFRMRNALQRHMESHNAEGRPYECNICHVRFPRPSQLTLHKLTVHKFEKPISCGECGKQFGTESAMKAHAKEHEDARATTEASTSASSSSLSPPQLSSSGVYLDAMTTKLTTTSSSTTITTNEQNMNLKTATSGEQDSVASDSISTTNSNNEPMQNMSIISELRT